jgi:tRNA (mo5U34)-methyltransferase
VDWHSFELPGGTVTEGVNSLASQRLRLTPFRLPEDLTGKRVLDIGAWDGWFSFELERRGAEVVAIDIFDHPRLREWKRVLGSRVEYRQIDVYDLSPERVGRFDIVLFLAVLVHLRHPLLALDRIRSVTDGMACVESRVMQERFAGDAEAGRPLLEFFSETGEPGGNWCVPTVPCLLAFCRSAGFTGVELRHVHEFGAAVVCRATP